MVKLISILPVSIAMIDRGDMVLDISRRPKFRVAIKKHLESMTKLGLGDRRLYSDGGRELPIYLRI